ncbi:hypothetical protein HBI56_142940 [Parastagonospora nodorum]|uniref:Uncharacterized protein n=1 Tax=Phaeosphaeria nodorum (strain SN15 / ATCC MYA-4574 / FGSC 10173) TaxID=321614 RepID=A0A7U2I3A8_PHANO|nr:hypothetical protein HBH56_034110 [Parastagonospora nodorum]QRD00184.1 hypothetical protein JI435_414710 [Parastagonospora nodorum SN15]KAH3933656.1 hypothetical protein HBH54_065320 [Parastagonospora nodorum]KAH3952398.1 hypothetical protein HBH53_044710 [Parastagonospora nodorum]KAH3979900.1 hypothetical protein HBH51_055750 [Parastagonospora nodorum]
MTAMRAIPGRKHSFHRLARCTKESLLSDARMQAHVAARRYRPIAAERGLSPPRCNTFQVQLHDSKSTDTGLCQVVQIIVRIIRRRKRALLCQQSMEIG